jgi:hypothetical protein
MSRHPETQSTSQMVTAMAECFKTLHADRHDSAYTCMILRCDAVLCCRSLRGKHLVKLIYTQTLAYSPKLRHILGVLLRAQSPNILVEEDILFVGNTDDQEVSSKRSREDGGDLVSVSLPPFTERNSPMIACL